VFDSLTDVTQMIASSIPENSSEADLSRLAQMVMSLFDHWNLSNEDQAFLLGLAPGTGAFVCCSRATETWRTAG
jgi:hypothetical protein